MPKSNRLLRSTLLDKKPFCKNEGINPATLLKWVYRLFKHFLSVAGVIGTATNSKNGLLPSSQFLVRDTISADVQITSFTQIKDGITFFFGAGTSYFPQSNGVVFKMSGYNSALLICCNQNADSIYIRMIREGKDSGWKAI